MVGPVLLALALLDLVGVGGVVARGVLALRRRGVTVFVTLVLADLFTVRVPPALVGSPQSGAELLWVLGALTLAVAPLDLLVQRLVGGVPRPRVLTLGLFAFLAELLGATVAQDGIALAQFAFSLRGIDLFTMRLDPTLPDLPDLLRVRRVPTQPSGPDFLWVRVPPALSGSPQRLATRAVALLPPTLRLVHR